MRRTRLFRKKQQETASQTTNKLSNPNKAVAYKSLTDASRRRYSESKTVVIMQVFLDLGKDIL